MPTKKPVIQMDGIVKQFPGVLALDHVSFSLEAGEIHALMGENGAGKSTLVKVLTGVHAPDEGTILMNGTPISPKSPVDAQAHGISTVYQEVNLCHNLSVAENIFIGREPMKRTGIDWKTMRTKAREVLKKLNLDIDVTRNLDTYSVAIQQMVAIARALAVNCEVLILDEPTSSLDETETKHLFEILLALKKEGISIIFISHFIEQIYEICDRATVLRNGQYISTDSLKELSRLELISKMLGKEVGQVQKRTKSEEEVSVNKSFLKAEHLQVAGKVRDCSLDLREGEILGFAGLLGSGRTEAALTLYGVTPAEAGEIQMDGKKVALHSPREAIRHNIALCPEDRKIAGIIGDLSVRENIILALQAVNGMMKKLPRAEQDRLADEFIEKLRIKVSSPNQLVNTLSGGNQQKVILARWLAIHPELLILDEPTRGIDIGTKTEIQNLMIRLADEENMSVVFISSEMEELLNTCSRLAVFRDQKVIGELTGGDIEMNDIMASLAGGEHD